MATFKHIMGPAVNVASLVLAVAAVTIWSARLEHRVSGLETRVQALETASKSGPAKAQRAPPQAERTIREACATLARRATGRAQPPDSAGALRDLATQLGCAAPKNGN